jgi:hypothetical protein
MFATDVPKSGRRPLFDKTFNKIGILLKAVDGPVAASRRPVFCMDAK